MLDSEFWFWISEFNLIFFILDFEFLFINTDFIFKNVITLQLI